MPDFDSARARMVEHQLARRGIADPRVLEAMGKVPREAFVGTRQAKRAYDDAPLPIGEMQTISQPYIVAAMIEALQLKGGEKVMEIGAGSGYAAAVLAEIASEVYAIERIEALARLAKANLADAGCTNVSVRCADGTNGWPEHAPFDAILVSAGAPSVPEPLKAQLAPGGRLVVPVGTRRTEQELIRVTRGRGDDYEEKNLGAVRFVPLIGERGWHTG